jgi:hypothetical protein
VIGINTGNAKLKTPQISHAPAVFPQTAQRQDPMLPVAAAKTRMVLRNPSWKAVHGKRMTGHSQMAPSGFRSTPTSGCLSLNRLQCMATCLKDLQRNWTKTGILCGFTYIYIYYIYIYTIYTIYIYNVNPRLINPGS